MKRNLITYSFLSLSLVPQIILAQGFSLGVTNDTTFGTTLRYIREIINLAIPLLITAAFVVFFWGLSKFILNSNKQAEIENGKNYMMWGILALFILFSFQAIISFVGGDLFDSNSTDPNTILLPDGSTPSVSTSEEFRL